MRKRPAEWVGAREAPPTSCTTTLESASPPRASTTEPRTSATGWACNTAAASNRKAISFTGDDDSNLGHEGPSWYAGLRNRQKVPEAGGRRPGVEPIWAKSPMTHLLPAALVEGTRS